MYLLLALGAAAAYGAADFYGGLASRWSPIVSVIAVSQCLALFLVLALAPTLSAAPGSPAFGWGALAGVAHGAGLALLYRGLAQGRMSVVAPITGVCALSLPVLFALALGEHPGRWALVGIALAVVAIVLVSREPLPRATEPSARMGRGIIATAVGAGIGFGLFFIALAQTKPEAGLWPLVATRAVTVSVFGAFAIATGRSLRLPRVSLYATLASGALDIGANVLYLLSARGGLLSLAVTLTSLYPATTVLLARAVLRERLLAVQGIGLGCAAAAAVLITATQ